MSRYRRMLVLAAALLLAPAAALAEIPGLVWEPAEAVDSPVDGVSAPAGAPVLNVDDRWHVVYDKLGDIFLRVREAGGWLPVEPVSQEPALSQDPHLAFDGARLHVVWEDHRTGHPEVWTRRRDGTTWMPEECLSCDGVPTRAPVVAADGGLTFVLWEEGGAGGATAIQARIHDGVAWGSVQHVSSNITSAQTPSVTAHPAGGEFTVVWSDGRHGDPEIYSRRWSGFGGWQDELRVTDLGGPCRNPSVHAEFCCPDLAYPVAMVVFESENGLSAGTEILGVDLEAGVPGLPAPISTPDETPSLRPNIHGFTFSVPAPPFGGVIRKYFVTWSEPSSPIPEVRGNYLALVQAGANPDTTVITLVGFDGAAVGGIEGEVDAGVMVVWTEMLPGVGATLLSRRGSLPGAVAVEEPAVAPTGPAVDVAPNPSSETVTIRAEIPRRSEAETEASGRAAGASVRIFDAAGRCVRDLGSLREAGELIEAVWDGKDGGGRRVPAGSYFVRVECNRSSACAAVRVTR